MWDLTVSFEKTGQKLWSLSGANGNADIHTHTQTDTQTDRHTDKHSSDFMSVQWHALYWTDNNNIWKHCKIKTVIGDQ